MAALDFRIEGMDKFVRKSRRLRRRSTQRKVLRATANAGTQPIKRELRRGIRSAGAIRKRILLKSVASKVRFYLNGTMAVIVGVRNKFVDGENPGNYWHLVNLGTRPHGQPNLRVVLISRVGRNKSSGQFERQSGFVTLAREGEVFRHPGARARNIRNRAFMRARNEVPPKMAKKFKEAHEREVRRQ